MMFLIRELEPAMTTDSLSTICTIECTFFTPKSKHNNAPKSSQLTFC